MFTPEVMLATIAKNKTAWKTRGNNNGLYSQFAKITEDWGIKCFSSEYTRDNAFRKQSIAADVGVAPQVGECFDLECGKQTIYGYNTEICHTLAHHKICEDNGWDSVECNPYEGELQDEYLDEEAKIILSQEYRDMEEKLNDIYISTVDSHSLNFGWMKDGRMVWIDFS